MTAYASLSAFQSLMEIWASLPIQPQQTKAAFDPVKWAGVNCKQDQGIKQLIEWKNKISQAKTACEGSYSSWLTQKIRNHSSTSDGTQMQTQDVLLDP